MQFQKLIGKLWDGFDKLLMAAVIILLAAVWLSGRKYDESRCADAGAGLVAPAKSAPLRRVPGRVVEGLRVSVGADRRARVSEIARSITASDWASVPRSLAMDMREQADGKEYDIRLALPENVDADSVRVTASGHTLTLRMSDSARGVTYMRHVRVPCRAARENGVRSVVSNGLLHVRICAE